MWVGVCVGVWVDGGRRRGGEGGPTATPQQLLLLTMAPPPHSRMTRMAALEHRKVPRRFVAITLSKSSTSMSANVPYASTIPAWRRLAVCSDVNAA